MQRKLKYFNYSLLLLMVVLFIAACKKETYSLPEAKTELQNDCIKRTLGPNIVGQNIEFAYAMALGAPRGKLVSATVEASIPGDPATYLENKSFFTTSSGKDTGVVIGSASVNDGAKTTVSFTRDTSASTLRYYYAIPEAARGQKVSFTFTAKSSDGSTVSYPMGPYTISRMDMALNLYVSNPDTSYISIADMKVYNKLNVAANAAKIDLVYVYRVLPTLTYNHSIVSPAADPQYLPGVTLPAGVSRSTKMQKTFNLQDFNLARLQFGIYIDDLDFQKLDMTGQPNFAINLKAEAGSWVETADGKYKAYVYVNSVNNTSQSAVISIKRYTVEGK